MRREGARVKKVDPTQPVQMIVCMDFPNVHAAVLAAAALQNAARDVRGIASKGVLPPDWLDAVPGILQRLSDSIVAELEAAKDRAVKP